MSPHRKPFRQSPAAMPDSPVRAGLRLSASFETLIERSIGTVPAGLREAVRANCSDRSYLSGGTGGGDMALFFKMNRRRASILARADADFRILGQGIGWSPDTVSVAAALLMPLWDLSERLCVAYYGHQYRTMEYVGILLDQRGVAGKERSVPLMGALLHDIGKAAVPGETLRVHGRPRTPGEIKETNKHPVHGKSIILAASAALARAGFPISHAKGIADIAFTHQMKFDGLGGYPEGPIGDDIPSGGRIAAFCDAFETMTSKRIYELHPRDYEGAMAEAHSQWDKHFNRRIVRDFFAAAASESVRQRIFSIIRSAGGSP